MDRLPTLDELKQFKPANLISRQECKTGNSNKFYEIYQIKTPYSTYVLGVRYGRVLGVRYGRIDKDPTSRIKNYQHASEDTSSLAFRAGELAGQKAKKGYKVVGVIKLDLTEVKKEPKSESRFANKEPKSESRFANIE